MKQELIVPKCSYPWPTQFWIDRISINFYEFITYGIANA
jgi:hypothetical protein